MKNILQFVEMDSSAKEKSKKRKRDSSADNDYTVILQKIKKALMKMERKSHLYSFKDVYVISEQLGEIKKRYQRVLSPCDIANIKDIEKLLVELKTLHPELCSKSLSILSTTKESIINDASKSTVIDEQCNLNENQIDMDLDESLMNYNLNKEQTPTPEERKEHENIEVEENPPVASQKKQSTTPNIDMSSLNMIQKLYLQSLELWQCVDKYESERTKKK